MYKIKLQNIHQPVKCKYFISTLNDIHKLKQDRKCTYNVTLRRVRATIVAVEKQYYTTCVCVCVCVRVCVCVCVCVCICSLRYPACNAYAPYCHLCPTTLYKLFTHYLINGTIFEKKTPLNIKCVHIFYLRRFSKTFFILRKIERDMIKMYIFSRKVRF